jgi:integrase
VATRPGKARTDVDPDGQLELFDGALNRPLPVGGYQHKRGNGDVETFAAEIARPSERPGVGRHAGADRAVLRALEEALTDAREAGDDRPALAVLASCLGVHGAPSTPRPAHGVSLRQAGDDWLRRLETQQKSESTLVGYRVAIDDLLDWAETNGRDVLTETAMVDYLHSYQERAHPAEASYYRRFVLLRKFVRWVCRRDGVPDPFLDLDAPPKPRQQRDWLTPEEFRRLLDAAGRPERNLPGLAERDRLVLLALVTTGLRRSELCALEWRDLELGGREPSLLVRHGKGSKSRRQPLPATLARELRRLRAARKPEPTPSSAGSRAADCRKRSSPTSSVAPRSAPGSRSTSPRTRCATPRRLGSGRKAAIPASSPSTLATPTFQPSCGTRTSTARSCSKRLVDSRSSPLRRKNRRRPLISSRQVTLGLITCRSPATHATTTPSC